MQIVIDIPDAPIKDYQDLFYKICGMAASEGLYDDKVKSQRALALKVVLDILDGIVNGTPLPKGHGRIADMDEAIKCIEEVEGEDAALAIGLIEWACGKRTIIEADKSECEEKE